MYISWDYLPLIKIKKVENDFFFEFENNTLNTMKITMASVVLKDEINIYLPFPLFEIQSVDQEEEIKKRLDFDSKKVIVHGNKTFVPFQIKSLENGNVKRKCSVWVSLDFMGKVLEFQIKLFF